MDSKLVEQDCRELVEQLGFILYDCEYTIRNKHLKITILDPKTNSAVLDDCVKVDRAFTQLIEERDYFPEDLSLEVSSPGIYRKLSSDDHFKRSIGERVRLKVEIQPHEKPNQIMIGVLRDLRFDTEENIEQVVLEAEAEAEEVLINYKNILSAKWEPDI
jgi:ribosome maturation factor RimP